MKSTIFTARFVRLVALPLVFLGFLTATGCGGSGSVSGVVKYNGATLRAGQISFTVVKGEKKYGDTKSCAIKDDGSYTIPTIPSGEVKITVTTTLRRTDGAKFMPKDMGAGMKPEGDDSAAGPDKYVKLPQRYATVEATDLTYIVKRGPQTYDIELKP